MSLRLYKLTWTFDDWARNRKTPEKFLLLDVPAPSNAAAAGDGGGA
jgi:hypothetical protein